MQPSIDEQVRSLSRRTATLLTEGELRAKLARSRASGRPLRIKLGMDPTAPDVTLGHVVPLKIVRQFQDWGHVAVLIVGDYTARVGDPTGRNTTRPVLSGGEIDENARTYVEQVGKVLRTDAAHLEVRYNSEWLAKMSFTDIVKLLSRKSVAQVLAREDFAQRYKDGIDIRLHELVYPLLQGWDSVMVSADAELGGRDQLFNNLVGRDFQQAEGHEPQVVLVTPLLVGTDGQVKMSKSKGNYIGVTDPPGGQHGMFGKIMSIPDTLLESYFTLLTDLPPEGFMGEIAANPRAAKARLAKAIITEFHGAAEADTAEADFVRATHGGVPADMPEVAVGAGPHKLAAVLVAVGFVASKSEASRKIKEGAVRLDGQKVTDLHLEFSVASPMTLQLGSRRFVRLV